MYLCETQSTEFYPHCDSRHANDAPSALLTAAREELAGIFRAICLIETAIRANRIRQIRLEDAHEELQQLRDYYAVVYSEIRDAFDTSIADEVHREVQEEVPADLIEEQRLQEIHDYPLLAELL